MTEEKIFSITWLRVMAIAFIISTYIAPFSIGVCSDANLDGLPLLFIFLPILIGIVNFIVILINRKKIDRVDLLKCTTMIKYLMIPFYIIGGIMIGLLFLMGLIPVPFMIFLTPFVGMILAVFGWFYMVASSSFSLIYLVKSAKEGIHHTVLCVIAGICQYFFVADVVSIAILALKEKKCVKSTVATLIILGILALLTILAIAGIVVAIVFTAAT